MFMYFRKVFVSVVYEVFWMIYYYYGILKNDFYVI